MILAIMRNGNNSKREHTEHCSRSERVLSKEGMLDVAYSVLSITLRDNRGTMSMQVTRVTRELIDAT